MKKGVKKFIFLACSKIVHADFVRTGFKASTSVVRTQNVDFFQMAFLSTDFADCHRFFLLLSFPQRREFRGVNLSTENTEGHGVFFDRINRIYTDFVKTVNSISRRVDRFVAGMRKQPERRGN